MFDIFVSGFGVGFDMIILGSILFIYCCIWFFLYSFNIMVVLIWLKIMFFKVFFDIGYSFILKY